jgi:hypothetical protein
MAIMTMTSMVTTPSAANEVAKNGHTMSLLGILLELYLLFLAQARYLYPNTPMAVKPLFHLRSDPTAQPFDISFSPNPTSCHYCPYTTIGADINITGPPPTPKTSQTEDILHTITANAENNLQHHERGKLGCSHKPSTPTTPFIHGDEVIGKMYRKNVVLIPFTIDPWARFGPMLQAFLTTTHHPHQKS